ncbi:MAG: XrtA system polysaccharide chain length determinant, partial [Pseudomonadales bacterium]
GLIDDKTRSARVASVVRKLSSKVKVVNSRGNYFSLSYSSDDADNCFQVASALVEEFIEHSAESQRTESKEAFLFIDSQVKNYKKQLLNAEENLKQFRSRNRDGTEASVTKRIAGLRENIEQMKLDLDELQTRKQSLQRQLKDEGQYVINRYKNDEYRKRLSQAQSKLDELLLLYTRTHPDVMNLQEQIDELQATVANSEVQGISSLSSGSESQRTTNPLYDELRSKLADVSVEVRTTEKRLAANERRLAGEYERAKRVAERQAELAELSRDYNVTKNIYEDMLDRKEKARLSMTLDLEGRGVSYKVREPPNYPELPKGLRLAHFLLAGPLLGIAIPIGLIFLYIKFDPRIRLSHLLEENLPVPVLGVVPHVVTPFRKRLLSKDFILLSLLLLVVVGVYAGVALVKILGTN